MAVGDRVKHNKFGTGIIIARWGAILVDDPEGKRKSFYTSGDGIVDVLFDSCLHSCREEYLICTPI